MERICINCIFYEAREHVGEDRCHAVPGIGYGGVRDSETIELYRCETIREDRCLHGLLFQPKQRAA